MLNSVETIQKLTKRLAYLEAETKEIRRQLQTLPRAEIISVATAAQFPALNRVNKTDLGDQISRALNGLEKPKKAIDILKLQNQMTLTSLDQNELSRSIIELREE